MKILTGGFLMLFGLVWFAINGVVNQAVGQFGNLGFMGYMVALGPVLFIIGAILLVLGLFDMRKRSQAISAITQQGVVASGTVTFVDKNYSLLVNEKPIYSIVEFVFKDSLGREHTVRKDNVNSDMVIRNRIEVGSQINLKYLPQHPDENMLLLADPRSGAQTVAV